MLKLFFLFALACTASKPDDTTTPEETAIEETSPITWEECSFRIGEHICDIELPAHTGKVWSLYENHGRPMVIDLSTEWCPVCKTAAQQAESIMQDWSSHNLLWVTILVENDQGEEPTAQDLAEWESNYGVTNSIILAGSRDLIEASGQQGFPLTSWPTFVILTDDLLIFHGVGGWSEEYLNQKLTEMLVNQ